MQSALSRRSVCAQTLPSYCVTLELSSGHMVGPMESLMHRTPPNCVIDSPEDRININTYL